MLASDNNGRTNRHNLITADKSKQCGSDNFYYNVAILVKLSLRFSQCMCSAEIIWCLCDRKANKEGKLLDICLQSYFTLFYELSSNQGFSFLR